MTRKIFLMTLKILDKFTARPVTRTVILHIKLNIDQNRRDYVVSFRRDLKLELNQTSYMENILFNL